MPQINDCIYDAIAAPSEDIYWTTTYEDAGTWDETYDAEGNWDEPYTTEIP